ncbi:ribosome recycling factor [Sulfobacillus harzensis]|uniref:Ribosome-recycling factor n=1 Tax=Sulfobacillus harzensis TaxID=2729629 RepID=A0A7Y0L1Z5_9FIRM|nr:ribosome recycling factor [Sulfobacillus harzensis]NMP21818.1 ribosome recycling factor [Sulfobacillus harzensis]
MLKDILKETEEHMQKSVEVFQRDLAGMRAGRAHPALLEKVPVDYYGTTTPLQHLAAISAPEPRVLVVQPFDKSAVSSIEKALMKADLGVSVRVDGALLRVNVPQLTEERRRDLVKQLRRQLEEAKVAVRNVRRDGLDALKRSQKAGEVSEDEERRGQTDIQRLTDQYIKELDRLAEAREKDIMTP